MFTLIKELAELEGQDSGADISDHLANPASKQCKEARFLELEEVDGKINYKGITSIGKELRASDDTTFLLYPKHRAPNGPNKTPTVVYNDYDKSYVKKIFAWFESNQNKNILFKNILECLKNNQGKIKEDLTDFPKNTFLSIKVNNQFIGEIQAFQDLFNDEEFIESISGLKGKPKVILEDAICSVCFENKDKLYGYSIPYTFASISSNYSYGFDEKNAAKQIPVCVDCAKSIRGKGTKFLEDNLKFTLANNQYFLIPELVYKTNENKIKFKKVLERLKHSREDLFSIDKKDRDKLIECEKSVLHNLKDENYLIYNLFFYNINNQEFQILANIEEVLPSSLKKLFDSVQKYEGIFRTANINLPSKEGISFDFNFLYHLLGNDKVDFSKRSKKEFFEVLDKILNLKKLSYEYFIDKAVKKIQENAADFLQDNFSWVKQITFNSFLLINILADLRLISIGEIKNMPAITNETTEKLEEFYNRFPDFFNTDSKKALFALGVLTEKLATIQFANRGSKPIYKKLKNFKLEQKYLIQNLIPELKDKFLAYNAHSKEVADYLETITTYFMSDTKQLSAAETSYIFVFGMNMQNQIFPSKKNNNATDNNKETNNDN